MFFVFCFYFDTDGKVFAKMVFASIAQHNVHQQPIMQVLLMITLMVFNGLNHKSEKYNLLMVTMEFELYKIVLLHHKTLRDLIISKIMYYIQILNGIQLNFILFQRNINYNSKVLQEKETMQSIHVMIIKLSWIVFDNEEKAKKLSMQVPRNMNLTDLNDINIGNSPDMMHDTSSNSGINNIVGVVTESHPPILIHPAPSETQTLKGYTLGDNKAESYLITGVTGALLNSNQSATDIGLDSDAIDHYK